MPVAKVQLPDGRIARLEVPEGTTEQQVMEFAALLEQQKAPQTPAPAEEPKAPAASAPDSAVFRSPIGGFVRGLLDIPDAGAQLLRRAVPEGVASKIDAFGNMLADAGLPLAKTEGVEGVDALVKQNEQAYQAARAEKGADGMDWGRLGGNIAATIPIAMAAPTGGGGLLARTLAGAGQGAAVGALQPVTEGDFASEKANQISVGTLFGSFMPAVTSGIARMVKPQTAPEVVALMKEGVTPTPGQVLGGAAKRVEEGLTSVPVIGDAIKTGQRRATEEFNRAAINRVLAPVGQSLPKNIPVGREAVKFAGEAVSKAYDDLLPKLNIQADKQFAQEIGSLRKLAQNLPEAQAKQFSNILKNDVLGKFERSGKMMGETMKGIESNLGRLVRSYGRSENPDHRLLADALKETQAALRSMVERGNPQHAGALAKVNEAYANLLRVESAAGRLGSKDGIFSAAGLTGAAKAKDASLNKRAFARGKALMQDLGETGQQVLGQTVPDSGTPFRAMNALALGTGAVLSPAATAGALGASALYTAPAQKLMAKLLTERPEVAQAIADQVRKGGALAPALAPLLMESGQR